jgi:isopenicillin N synthase-like dioxygenase
MSAPYTDDAGGSLGTTDAVGGLQATLEAYHRAMQVLAHKVERCFALALGLEEYPLRTLYISSSKFNNDH